jgi:hypothetical protein
VVRKWFSLVAYGILGLGRGVGRRKCGLRLLVSGCKSEGPSSRAPLTGRQSWGRGSGWYWIEENGTEDWGGSDILDIKDLQTIVAPLVSDS